jgi:hypothetical protein
MLQSRMIGYSASERKHTASGKCEARCFLARLRNELDLGRSALSIRDETRGRLTNSGLGQIVSVFPSTAPTPLLAAALDLRISTSEAIGAGLWLDIIYDAVECEDYQVVSIGIG